MNRYLLIFTFLLTSFHFANAKEQKDKNGLKTKLSFEDLLVQGKYHFSDEAVTTVEEDKILDALLPVRKDFKDRIKKSASRH